MKKYCYLHIDPGIIGSLRLQNDNIEVISSSVKGSYSPEWSEADQGSHSKSQMVFLCSNLFKCKI